MKIAQVSPLYEAVPPRLYGGTERIVSYLTESLVEAGHDVTLYASGDSVTKARLVAICERSLRLDKNSMEPVADHMLLLEKIMQEAPSYDIVHSHVEYLGLPFLRRLSTPHLTTLHNRLDVPNYRNLFREFNDEPLVSISNSQRQPMPGCNWQGTVHHGIPEDLYQLQEKPQGYLAFIGRISPEKRVDDAIEIARQAGLPLKIAAKVDEKDRKYFESCVRPLLQKPGIEFIGEIGEKEKQEFLGNALALLFPIEWPEPFGLVMIEAMACGTPVVARRCGAVPEVIDEGLTGCIFSDPGQAAFLVRKAASLDRRRCRRQFEERFTSQRMAADYVQIYHKLIHEAATGTKSYGRCH